MLIEGQIWKNGSRIAQISIEKEIFKAIIFKMEKRRLSFSEIIDIENEQILSEKGFKPTLSHVLVAKDR